MRTLNMFTQENVCSTCIHDRYGCNKFSGMAAGWNDKGEGIIVACDSYTKDTPEEDRKAREYMQKFYGIA